MTGGTLVFQPDSGTIGFGNSTSHRHYVVNPPGEESIQVLTSGSIRMIPEPSTYALLGGGLAALASRRRYYVKKEGKGKARNYYH